MRKLVIMACVALLLGCGAKDPEKINSDKVLHEYGLKLYKDGEYTEAIKFFESLKNRFPQSPYALESELKVADAHFEKDDYAEAEVSYQTFRTLHPTNGKIPYVNFRIGMTHYKRIPRGIDRDQQHTEKAVEIFSDLVSRWPNALETSEARQLIVKCKRALAERELYVANFYLHQHQYRAALQRLESLRGNTEFNNLRAEAGYKLGYAYYKLEDREQAKKVLSEVITNPEAGKYRSQAKDLLRKVESM